jgi:hypothetical protein
METVEPGANRALRQCECLGNRRHTRASTSEPNDVGTLHFTRWSSAGTSQFVKR